MKRIFLFLFLFFVGCTTLNRVIIPVERIHNRVLFEQERICVVIPFMSDANLKRKTYLVFNEIGKAILPDNFIVLPFSYQNVDSSSNLKNIEIFARRVRANLVIIPDIKFSSYDKMPSESIYPDYSGVNKKDDAGYFHRLSISISYKLYRVPRFNLVKEIRLPYRFETSPFLKVNSARKWDEKYLLFAVRDSFKKFLISLKGVKVVSPRVLFGKLK